MHRVARPDNLAPLTLYRADEARQVVFNLACAETGNQRQPSGLVFGVECVDQAQKLVGLKARAAFQPDRVHDATAKFNMRAIGLAGAVANPDHMAGACNRLARKRIDPAQRLFIFQQQRLVAGVEIHLGQRLHA